MHAFLIVLWHSSQIWTVRAASDWHTQLKTILIQFYVMGGKYIQLSMLILWMCGYVDLWANSYWLSLQGIFNHLAPGPYSLIFTMSSVVICFIVWRMKTGLVRNIFRVELDVLGVLGCNLQCCWCVGCVRVEWEVLCSLVGVLGVSGCNLHSHWCVRCKLQSYWCVWCVRV